MKPCPDCETAKTRTYTGGVYNFKCEDCRTRFLQDEPCKKYREQWAKHLTDEWGSVGNWQTEPNCGCSTRCQRFANVEKR